MSYRTIAILFSFFLSAGICHAQEENITIALIGDSTVTDQSGWGKAFAGRFNDNVKTLNFSAGGRSSKSWCDENRLPEVLNVKPDFVLIQFGHNDQPGKGAKRETDPASSYRDYLKTYVKAFREIGATPILVSSVTRRRFNENDKIQSTLTPWADAVKAVAVDMKVPFIDLHSASIEYHNKIGPKMSMAFNPREGDVTHFNQKGAEAIAGMIVEKLKQACEDLVHYLK